MHCFHPIPHLTARAFSRPLFCALLIALLLMTVSATPQNKATAQASVTLPETAPGKQFAAWLTALNSGKREALRQFIADQLAPPPNGTLPIDGITERHWGIYKNTLGFDLRKITNTTPEKIAVIMQAKRTGYWMMIGVQVAPQAPAKILGFGFRNIEAPVELLPTRKLTEKEVHDKVDHLITTLVATDSFSGVVFVAKENKPIYQRACGLANRAWNAPNRIDTKFNLASVGKMFTAVAIAQLVEQNKLSYHDTVGKILPDFPNQEVAQKVTVHHLLTHTSGLPNAQATQLATMRQVHRKISAYLPALVKTPLAFEPGTRFEYTNDGYLLLGLIIEKVSGQDYYDYIREHIYRPAGMLNSDSYDLDADVPNLATGYMDAPNQTRRSNTYFLPVRGLPYGLGYATAGDVMRFGLALRNHTLLNAQSLDLAWAGKVAYTAPDSQYGYGFIVKRYNGVRIVGHAGGWFGVNTEVDFYPDLGYSVIILANYDADTTSLTNKLREWLTQGRG